jgi:hypothetical protein
MSILMSLTLREGHRLMVCENRVLTRIFGTKRDVVTGMRENCVMRSFLTCKYNYDDQVKENEMGRACTTN